MDYIFVTDLDSTIITTKNPPNNIDYKCISETKRGKSFISIKNKNTLNNISENIEFIPLTTRGLNSYFTINLDLNIKYALVDNGCILLNNNEIDEDWLLESRNIFKEEKLLFNKGKEFLLSRKFENKTDSEFIIDFRKPNIEHSEYNEVFDELTKLIGSHFYVYKAGTCGIFAIHKKLTKGDNLTRLKQILPNKQYIIAGDSKSDWSMLKLSELSIGLSDSPSTIKFDKNLFKINQYDFLDFVIKILDELIKEETAHPHPL